MDSMVTETHEQDMEREGSREGLRVGDIVSFKASHIIDAPGADLFLEYPQRIGTVTSTDGPPQYPIKVANIEDPGIWWWFPAGHLRLCDGTTEDKHGHPRFYEILESLGDFHDRKNHDYAGGGAPLGNFERRSQLYSMYPRLDLSNPVVVAMVDAMKQLDAALWFLSNKHEARVEGLEERLRDVAVYAILAMVLQEER